MANSPIPNAVFNLETLTISVDPLEIEDLHEFLDTLSVQCALISSDSNPTSDCISVTQADPTELQRVKILVEEFNKMRKSRLTFGS